MRSQGPRLLAIVHQEDAGPGVFADEAHTRGWRLDQWLLPETPEPPADPGSYDAVISFGGAMHAHQVAEFPWLAQEKEVLRNLIDAGVPTMGVCLGSQLLADAVGSPVERAPEPEIGWFEIELTSEGREDPVTSALGERFCAFQWHSYHSPLPAGAIELAANGSGLQAYRIGDSAWGIQFHAEVSEVDAVSWAVNYGVDEDAVRIGIDPDALSAQILERIGEWNRLGRGLCGRFLDAAG